MNILKGIEAYADQDCAEKVTALNLWPVGYHARCLVIHIHKIILYCLYKTVAKNIFYAIRQ